MTAFAVRPQIGEHRFQMFDRPLHPELFETVSYRKVTKGKCTISLRVIPYGHVMEWTMGRMTAAEVVAGPAQPLPLRGRRLNHAFDSNHAGQFRFGPIRYCMQMQVERLDAEQFLQVNCDLIVDGVNRGLLVRHGARYRSELSALSWLDVTPVVGGVVLYAIHTIPHERAILKTQSLIEPR
jgi:Protein of unknown function DUF2617